jgi:hypothetical protein
LLQDTLLGSASVTGVSRTRRVAQKPVDAKVADDAQRSSAELQQKDATRAVGVHARSKRANWSSSLPVAVPAERDSRGGCAHALS